MANAYLVARRTERDGSTGLQIFSKLSPSSSDRNNSTHAPRSGMSPCEIRVFNQRVLVASFLSVCPEPVVATDSQSKRSGAKTAFVVQKLRTPPPVAPATISMLAGPVVRVAVRMLPDGSMTDAGMIWNPSAGSGPRKHCMQQHRFFHFFRFVPSLSWQMGVLHF